MKWRRSLSSDMRSLQACKISLLPTVAAEAFGAGPAEVGQIFSALAALAIGGRPSLRS